MTSNLLAGGHKHVTRKDASYSGSGVNRIAINEFQTPEPIFEVDPADGITENVAAEFTGL